jgi:hypothetical protein
MPRRTGGDPGVHFLISNPIGDPLISIQDSATVEGRLTPKAVSPVMEYVQRIIYIERVLWLV